jgi:hypothetical protein
LVLVGFICFTVVDVTLVVITGFARNMNHIVLGVDDIRSTGICRVVYNMLKKRSCSR